MKTEKHKRADERKFVDRALMSAGLGSLDDPGLVGQIGFLARQIIKEHKDFMLWLGKAPLDKRRDMYEAMKPFMDHLPGGCKSLEAYQADLMIDAEVRQLPIQGADGNLLPFRAQDLVTRKPGELGVAQSIFDHEYAKHVLRLTCKRCTFFEEFPAIRKEDAVFVARETGWIIDLREQVEICPKCAEKL